MPDRIGIFVNGATGRMAKNQHLINSLLPIRRETPKAQWNLGAVKFVAFHADRHSAYGGVCNDADPVSHN